MEESELIKNQREKLDSLRAEGLELYPNDVRVTSTAGELHERFGSQEKDQFEKIEEVFSVAGRLMAIRDFGKASFISVQDRSGRIQAYVRRDRVGERTFSIFKKLDVGDIVYVAGRIFKTKTSELTIEAAELRLLAKSLLPLPEKWHGLSDTEIRYRQRYLDLIMNPNARKVFQLRTRIIELIRNFLRDRDFLEVETPMMQTLPGGAMAKPFMTHHNALGMDLYLRIAPELFLKRLLVGGLERVFEINRNFRNEGISTLHNPEFTMVEFYEAYATYEDFMNLTEEMIARICLDVRGSYKVTYQGQDLDFTPPWTRMTVREALVRCGGIDPAVLAEKEALASHARSIGLAVSKEDPYGTILMAVFDELVEDKLVQPTFITQYPLEVSPLSRKNPADPSYTDRFELYICGREIANAFSELNDPADQRERFLMQLRQREGGDEEAHAMDEDYVRALEYGMPPAAGEGIGIDRLVMLFTDSASIRDVILFPHMRLKE